MSLRIKILSIILLCYIIAFSCHTLIKEQWVIDGINFLTMPMCLMLPVIIIQFTLDLVHLKKR